MAIITSAEIDQNAELLAARSVHLRQHYSPHHGINGFAQHAGTKVRIVALRWDNVHTEFQYLIKVTFIDRGTWVSEKALK